MIKLNIHEAKTHLSKYLERVAHSPGRKAKRPLGLARGKFEVPPEFFLPLPDEIIDSFHGKTS